MTAKKPSPETHQKQKKEKKNSPEPSQELPPEFGGTKGLEPTRYGDWEKNGRCVDF